ncbi:MAG: YicC/YloC family endoribonuclease, partial [Burkholderiaceae bacterium]
MTGYASVQCAAPNSAGTTIGIELRAVNSRFLDITFKMPDEWRAVELPMRQLLGRHVQRGKLELRGFCRLDQGPRAPDSAQLQQLLQLQQQVQAVLPQATPLSVAQALSLTSGPSHWTPNEALLLQLTEQALTQLQSARLAEGQRLAEVIGQHMA